MEWNGRKIRPVGNVIKSKEFDFQDALKPLGEKRNNGFVWVPGGQFGGVQPPDTSPVPTTPTPTPTISLTPNPTSTPTNTPTQTQTGTPNVTSSPTNTPTQTQSGTPNITSTPTNTPTQTQTGTPQVTTTPTNTPTQTQSGTPNVTSTPTSTPTQTGTPNVTSTPTQTTTQTPTPSQAAGTTEARTYLSAVVSAGGSVSAPMSAATITMFQSIWSNGLNTNMLAMYPFIGGTAASHKFNGMNPVDTDGGYRLTFAGGWTHSASGATPNGTNGVAETYLTPSTTSFTLSGGSMGVYCGTNGPSGAAMGSIGDSGGGSGDGWVLYPGLNNPGLQEACFFWKSDAGAFNGSTMADTLGLMSISRTGTTNVNMYRRGTLLASPTFASNSLTNFTLALGARNTKNGAPAEYSTYRQQFTYIHRGLTPTQMTTLNGIIQTYQTSLGRNVY